MGDQAEKDLSVRDWTGGHLWTERVGRGKGRNLVQRAVNPLMDGQEAS